MKTKKFFSALLAVLMMAVILSSCSTTMKVVTDGHHILTQELMDNPGFNNTEKLQKIQWYSGAEEIVLVRSYETKTDTVIDGQYITSVINIDTVRIPSFTSGVLVSPDEMGVAFEDSSSCLKFTPNKKGQYVLAIDSLRYGDYEDWKLVAGKNTYLLFDLVKSEEVKTGRVVSGMRVALPEE